MRSFRESLLAKIEESGTSLRRVAQGSGVSYEQLKKLKQIETRTTNVEDALKIARFFGVTLEEFIAGRRGSDQREIVALLESLSDEAREFLINAARAQAAAEAARAKCDEVPE